MWTRLGDLLIESGSYDYVLVVPFGIGGAKISTWIPGGDLHSRVQHSAELIQAEGILPTHVLWHQGESDNISGTSGAEYSATFGQLLKSLIEYGIDAPVYPAVATLCSNHGSDDIRAAQKRLSSLFDGVYVGPNTDALDRFSQRTDFCHFSEEGLEASALLWLQALSQEIN